jgi:hypothetical protein
MALPAGLRTFSPKTAKRHPAGVALWLAQVTGLSDFLIAARRLVFASLASARSGRLRFLLAALGIRIPAACHITGAPL